MLLINKTIARKYLDDREASLFIMYLNRCMPITTKKPIISTKGAYVWSNHYDLHQALDMLKKRKPSPVVKRHINTTKMLIEEQT